MSTENPNSVVSEQGTLLQNCVIGGVELKAGMSAQERFAAIAKSIETGAFAPKHNGAGPPNTYQTSSTQQRLAQGDKQAAPNAIGNKPAPTPKELESANKPLGKPNPDRLGEFDREMQSQGKQIRPDSTVHIDGQPDLQAADRLTARYRKLRETLTGEKAAQELRESYERDMRRVLEGRPLTELELSIDPSRKKPATPATKGTQWSAAGKLTPAGQKMQADLLNEWKGLPEAEQRNPTVKADYDTALAKTAANERGVLSAGQFNPASLSGYTLPAGDYLPETIQDLAKARAAGLSQAQLETAIRNLRGGK